MADNERERNRDRGFIGTIIKFVVNAVVLLLASYLTPGFVIAGFWRAILAAVVITVLDYIVQALFKIDASPFGRGLSGFITAAIIIYLTQFIIAGVAVSVWGAIIGALLIGIIDAIIPTEVF